MKNSKLVTLILFVIITFSNYLYAADSVLKWDAVSGNIDGYKIYYGFSQGSYPLSEDVGNITQYSLNNFSLSEGTTYYFVVRAYNASGESGNSNMATYTVPNAGDTTPPIPPEGISGEIINKDILLTWQANSEADLSGYRLYYGTASRDYGLPITVSGTEYLLSALDTGVLYFTALTAVDTTGNESGYSSPEIIKIISTVGSGSLIGRKLRWDPVAGDVSGYKIYYGTSEGIYTENIDVGDVTQYALDNFSLTEGTTYYFIVRAYNAFGESGNSNIATHVIGIPVDATPPLVPIESSIADAIYNTTS